MRCGKCLGTGQYLGNGMQIIDCNICDGYGKLPAAANVGCEVTQSAKDTYIDKRSKHYRDAVQEIMLSDPELSRDDAVKLFEETYKRSK